MRGLSSHASSGDEDQAGRGEERCRRSEHPFLVRHGGEPISSPRACPSSRSTDRVLTHLIYSSLGVLAGRVSSSHRGCPSDEASVLLVLRSVGRSPLLAAVVVPPFVNVAESPCAVPRSGLCLGSDDAHRVVRSERPGRVAVHAPSSSLVRGGGSPALSLRWRRGRIRGVILLWVV